MSNFNGARRKATVGNRTANSQSSGNGAKNKYFSQNNAGDGWGNTGRRPSRSTSDDGWGEINKRPSNYTSGDLWGPLPSQPTVTENAWGKKDSKKNQKSYSNQGKKSVPLVGPSFSWNDDDYPALESRPPVENVWEKRKEKLEGRKAMEPTNLTEEELMIQKAIELSKLEAKEEEERRRQIEEEYELQNVILASNPEFFSDFLTPDELAVANKSSEPEETEYQSKDLSEGFVEKQSIWDIQEPVESQCSQKESKKSCRKKKRNPSQSSTHEEITPQNAWSSGQKFDLSQEKESILPKQTVYEDDQDKWSQNATDEKYDNETEENESQFVEEDSDYPSTEPTSTISLGADNESKLHKDNQPKISKVIDMFGGWGSKNIKNSSLKPSHQPEKFESNDNFLSGKSISNNEETFQDDREKPKEMSVFGENLQFPESSSKQKEDENFSINIKSQSSLNDDTWNNKYSSHDQQYNDELKPSLYNHVESNIATSVSTNYNAAMNPTVTSPSYLSKKSVPKDDDIMNNIVQDYASLAVNCTDLSPKEVPVQRKSKDIFNCVAPLLNDSNLNPNSTNLKSEITYSLNNAAPTEFSNNTPNDYNTGPWNDSKIDLPTNPERNELNDSLFSSHISRSVADVPNDLAGYSVDPAIPAPVHRETHFPCQPNPVLPNLINPNLMMGINPLMMQQMMMLNNPFFLQQLHQMEMYYRTLSMPFATPLISPMPSVNPLVNNPMGIFPNEQPNCIINPFPEQSLEGNPTIPPPCYNFENESQKSMPLKSDVPKSSTVPNVEFENSWLTDLLTEGEAHMDTFIPPPTMPENLHPAPHVENKVDVNIAQDILHNAYQNEPIPQNSNCDTKSLSQGGSTMKYGRTEDVAANTRYVNQNNPPNAVDDSGWGDINDNPKNNYTSWNDGTDGWADEKTTTSKSMINSSRHASRKQATCQPVRQPRQTSQW